MAILRDIQTTQRSSRIAYASCAILLCLSLLWIGLAGSRRAIRSRPKYFSGDWNAVGVPGDPRGIITFAPDGGVDSHDAYAGRWWFENGTIHIQFWDKTPRSIIEYVSPKCDEHIFSVIRSSDGAPARIQGTHVVLTRAMRSD